MDLHALRELEKQHPELRASDALLRLAALVGLQVEEPVYVTWFNLRFQHRVCSNEPRDLPPLVGCHPAPVGRREGAEDVLHTLDNAALCLGAAPGGPGDVLEHPPAAAVLQRLRLPVAPQYLPHDVVQVLAGLPREEAQHLHGGPRPAGFSFRVRRRGGVVPEHAGGGLRDGLPREGPRPVAEDDVLQQLADDVVQLRLRPQGLGDSFDGSSSFRTPLAS
mmetsp:Transcript_33893/g.95246  ORF Transcript_33893/g.95246 Transcript_33893/m.95246 type:complete len:220 (-) Transcript_33893:80-739(-)